MGKECMRKGQLENWFVLLEIITNIKLSKEYNNLLLKHKKHIEKYYKYDGPTVLTGGLENEKKNTKKI